jgi:predicted dehydrogenase
MRAFGNSTSSGHTPLRVGIVGCGRMGREHARTSRLLEAQVTLVCDNDVERAGGLQADWPESRLVEDPRQIDWSALDAVFVCTPPFARGPVEAAAIEAGVPFFVEKPVGLTADQCLPLLEALERRPVVHSVGYMNRYRPSIQEVRRCLDGRRLIGIRCHWVGPPYRPAWWLQADGSGGPFNEQCTHLVDICRYLLGEIVEVTAVAGGFPERPDIDATVAVALQFEGGACGTVLYSCLGTEKDIGVDVQSAEGRLVLRGWDMQLVAEDAPAAAPVDIFLREAEAFFSAIRSGDQGQVLCSLKDALQTQSAVDAVKRALRSGRREAVRDVSAATAMAASA